MFGLFVGKTRQWTQSRLEQQRDLEVVIVMETEMVIILFPKARHNIERKRDVSLSNLTKKRDL